MRYYFSFLMLLIIIIMVMSIGSPRISCENEEFPALKNLLRKYGPGQARLPSSIAHYYYPRAWTIDPSKGEKQLEELVENKKLTEPVNVADRLALLGDTIKKILEYHRDHPGEETMVNLATGEGVVAVNALPRLLTMYDHDRDGFIGNETEEPMMMNSHDAPEMGYFRKNILVLPYLKAMGFNTIHFQPVTEIGRYGRKGNLGSPFAISDPSSLDPVLWDMSSDFGIEEQYRELIEAAHALNMRVVQEVIPRTVSIDSSVLEKNPGYGYWVKEGSPLKMPDYYNPDYKYRTDSGIKSFPDRKSFEKWFYGEYKEKIYGGRYGVNDLIDVTKTDPEYSKRFFPPPDAVRREPSGKLVGLYYKKDGKGNRLIGELDDTLRTEVFPAFCDTPFEIQPFWSDVTYLKLYIDKDGKMPMLSPLSFVTAKFFKDVEPDVEKYYRNMPVWAMIAGCFEKFKDLGVDGFVLDMGHALPGDLKERIRGVLPVVWEENLGADFPWLAENAVVITGNVFSYTMPAYNDPEEMKLYEKHPEDTLSFHIKHIRELCKKLSRCSRYKGKMFASADNYNTKRIGQSPAARDLSKAPMNSAGAPDFTCAPVDRGKARKLTLMYYALFRILSVVDGSPFIFNPVYGTEFIPSSTINVGLNTHIRETQMFEEYMSPEQKKSHPHAPRLLLLSKPEKPDGVWENEDNILPEILSLNRALRDIKANLASGAHLDLIEAGAAEVLLLIFSARNESKLVVAVNLDVSKEHPLSVDTRFTRLLYSTSALNEKRAILDPGEVRVYCQ